MYGLPYCKVISQLNYFKIDETPNYYFYKALQRDIYIIIPPIICNFKLLHLG